MGVAHLRYSADQLLRRVQMLNGLAVTSTRHRAGFHSDKLDETTDRLGIAAEARTFAAIMVAKDVAPPLAIGLFGDWGVCGRRSHLERPA